MVFIQSKQILCYFLTPLGKRIHEDKMSLKNENELSCIEINPHERAKRTIIWLHGLGADGSDFVPMAKELRLPNTMNVRFVFPSARIMPVTINNGYEMRAWYDLDATHLLQGKSDQAGIERSVAAVHQLIKNEMANGIESNNIILGGFSQGGAMALTAGLSFPSPLGGIACLSGYMPLMGETLKMASSANKHTSVFVGHGMEDTVVSYALGKAVSVTLKQAGYPVEWHSYAMAHSVCAEEVEDISAWVQGVFK